MSRKRESATVRALRQAVIVVESTVIQLRGRIRDLEAQYARECESNKYLLTQHEQHAMVLQGDRDALTRTIEVLSRRLASPAADRNPYRAGWRGANMAINEQPLNEKATDPTPRRG